MSSDTAPAHHLTTEASVLAAGRRRAPGRTAGGGLGSPRRGRPRGALRPPPPLVDTRPDPGIANLLICCSAPAAAALDEAEGIA